MGYLDKIRGWFRQFFRYDSKVKDLSSEKSGLEEIDQLKKHYQELNQELEEIRLQLSKIDEQLNIGQIERAEHDREYRQNLARAGRIQIRQMEIRARLEDLESPIAESPT